MYAKYMAGKIVHKGSTDGKGWAPACRAALGLPVRGTQAGARTQTCLSMFPCAAHLSKIGFCLGQHCADNGNLVFIIRVKPVQNRQLKPLFEPHL